MPLPRDPRGRISYPDTLAQKLIIHTKFDKNWIITVGGSVVFLVKS